MLVRIFKTKIFHRWAEEIDLLDDMLRQAVKEMIAGQFETSLGGHLYKKRVAIGNKGKSAGLRTILAFKKNEQIFFLYGFAKNQRANISSKELEAYKDLARLLFSYNDAQIEYALKTKTLIEVYQDE